jgi:hypothetical protein
MGAPDILDFIPQDVFIDCRKYLNWTEMWEDVRSMPPEKIQAFREAGRIFLESNMAKKFYASLQFICKG